jgi:hypothetical protein
MRQMFTNRLVAAASLISAALNNRLIDARGFGLDCAWVTVPSAALREVRLTFPVHLIFLSNNWELEF